MYDIVFASNNKGKWLELYKDFERENINLILSKDHLNLIENDQILNINSFSKAESAAKQTGLMALGDDSGLCCTSLGYAPGVNSRRWFGNPADDKGRNRKLLELMEEYKGDDEREAFLISHFTLVDKDGRKLFTTFVKNRFIIADEIHDDHGFGYDAILIPDKNLVAVAVAENRIKPERAVEIIQKRLTIGQLSQEEKNAINDRGRIAKEIKKYLLE